jgi:hypothetical protein
MRRLVVATGGGAVIRPINWLVPRVSVCLDKELPLVNQ